MKPVDIEQKIESLRKALKFYGVREPTIDKIVQVYRTKGSGQAVLELYRQGYEIEIVNDEVKLVRKGNGE